MTNKLVDVQALLRRRHGSDIIEFEVSCGRTLRRIDAWALTFGRRDIAIGYEIKLNRSDFLNDKKWEEYLPYCHEFYFVAPAAVIHPNELPESAGLIHVSKHFKRLLKRRQSVRRDGIDEEMYIRILKRQRFSGESLEEWEAWAERRAVRKGVGWKVARRIEEDVRKGISEEQERLNKERQQHREQLAELKRAGVLDWSGRLTDEARDLIATGNTGPALKRIRDGHEMLTAALQALNNS